MAASPCEATRRQPVRRHRRGDPTSSSARSPVDEALAKAAGEALAAIPTATAVDAIVMASDARRGDVVYTSELEELTRLQRYFRAVRVLAV